MDAKKTISKVTDTMGNAKGLKTAIFVILGGLAAFYGGRMIVRRIRKDIDARKQEAQAQANDARLTTDVAAEVAKTIDNSKLTLSPADAKSICASIIGACQGYGTDEKAIFAQIGKIRTPDDWKLVYSTFGTVWYDGHDIQYNEPSWYQWGWEQVTLDTLLRRELDDDDIVVVKAALNQIGVKF